MTLKTRVSKLEERKRQPDPVKIERVICEDREQAMHPERFNRVYDGEYPGGKLYRLERK